MLYIYCVTMKGGTDMDTIFWLVALVLFLILEAGTVALVSAWFAAGALVALFASLLHAPLWLQALLFAVVSILLLACLRPITRKYFKPHLVRTNVDALLGAEGYVTAQIDNLAATGQVKLGAMEWTARSTSGAPIAKGTLVKVDRISGVKVYVTAVSNTEPAS